MLIVFVQAILREPAVSRPHVDFTNAACVGSTVGITAWMICDTIWWSGSAAVFLDREMGLGWPTRFMPMG